jgi:hypothetical protein
MAGHSSHSTDLEANPRAATAVAVGHLYTHTNHQRLMSCNFIPQHLIMLGRGMYN